MLRWMWPMTRLAVGVFSALAVFGGLEVWAAHGGPRLARTVSDSLPPGLYLFVPIEPHRGDIARVCLPPSIAAYALAQRIEEKGGDCPDGTIALGKVVAAEECPVVPVEPCDLIDVDRDGVRINGELWPESQPLERDVHGRRIGLRQPFGSRYLGPNDVWLMGRSRDSFDSRYIGPLSRSSIDGRFIPLFTQEKKK
jgi:type IV secretory pathway protease TraF